MRASPAQPQLFDSTFTSAHATRIIDEPECAFGMTYDAEAKLGADGCTTFTEEARWARQVPKVTPPLRNDVVGRAHAGKTVFLVTVQYFNAPDLSCGAVARSSMRRRDGS